MTINTPGEPRIVLNLHLFTENDDGEFAVSLVPDLEDDETLRCFSDPEGRERIREFVAGAYNRALELLESLYDDLTTAEIPFSVQPEHVLPENFEWTAVFIPESFGEDARLAVAQVLSGYVQLAEENYVCDALYEFDGDDDGDDDGDE